MAKVFVYGTLMTSGQNNFLLDGADYLGVGITAYSAYTMFDIGWFPGVVESTPGNWIRGEVYEVDPETFQRLDRLEGYPRLYTRKKIDVRIQLSNQFDVRIQLANQFERAWIYLINNAKNAPQVKVVDGVQDYTEHNYSFENQLR